MQKKTYNENYKKVSIKFNKHTESDMIDILEMVPNTSGFIKGLIKKWMEGLNHYDKNTN